MVLKICILIAGAVDNIKYMPWLLAFLFRFLGPYLTLSIDEGAYTSLFAATSPTVRANREFFKTGWLTPLAKITPLPKGPFKSDQLAKSLWETSDRVVTDVLTKGVVSATA